MILPARYRASLGVERGGYVILEEDDGGLRVTSPAGALERARALFRRYVPHDSDRPLASEELIAERRAEAAREDKEAEEALAAHGTVRPITVKAGEADGANDGGDGAGGRG